MEIKCFVIEIDELTGAEKIIEPDKIDGAEKKALMKVVVDQCMTRSGFVRHKVKK